ncbi:MAG: DUF4388 domain-containing protein [Planctomycetes bacterium]|nr:DUF4388 domain-containing protein [Planctomycetota bacterium]
MSLQGQIEETGLGPIIQTLSLNRYRGTLRIETEASSQFFFISEGEIVLVRQVKKDPVRLGDLLIAAGHITEEQLDEALSEQRATGRIKRLGETLIGLDFVTEDEIEQSVRDKFEEDFLDLFLLDRGRFEFIFGLTPEALFGPDDLLERITLQTSSLMMEAMRRVDEWQGMIRDLGNFDTMFRNRLQSQVTDIEAYEFKGVTLPAQTRRDIYDLLDGTRSLREVIASALEGGVATRLQTFLFLHSLQANNLIRPLDFKPLLASAKDALGSGDVSGAAKYIRAILGQKEGLDLGLVERYLRFLQDQQRPRLAFDEACRFAARCLSDDDTERAITLYESALQLYPKVEVIDRLFYALLRANKRERAVEVALKLRDLLPIESSLGVAQRISQNLQELAPEDPGVIELRGLILKRIERNEEALTVLEEALGKMPQDHPRRGPLISAMLELAPERDDLRGAQELHAAQEARLRVRRERRLRLIAIGATVLVALLLWQGYSEWRSRALLNEAERVLADAGSDPEASALRKVGLLLTGVRPLTTVSGRAEALLDEVEGKASELEQETRKRVDELNRRQLAEAEATEAARVLAETRQKLSAALANFLALVSDRDFEGASQQAVEIKAKWPKIDDPDLAREAGRLKVYTRIESTPLGANVLLGGKVLGKTPYVIGTTFGKPLTVRIRRAGYRTESVAISGTAGAKESLTLRPGATWSQTVAASVLDPVATVHGPLMAETTGSLVLLDLSDGSERWRVSLPGSGDVTGVGVAGESAIVVRGRNAFRLTLAAGHVEWERELKGEGVLEAPSFGKALGQDVALVAGGKGLWVLEIGTGAVLLEIHDLPAGGAYRPVCLAGWGFLPLVDRVIGFSLTQPGDRRQAWAKIPAASRWERPVVSIAPLVPIPTVEALVAQVAGGELRVIARQTGVTTPIAPAMGPLVGIAEHKGSIYCLARNGQLASFRSDGLEVMAAKPVLPAASGGPVLVGGDLLCVDKTGRIARFSLSGKRRKEAAPILLGQALKRPAVATDEGVLILTGTKLSFIEPQLRK